MESESFKIPVSDQVIVTEQSLRHTVTEIFQKMGLAPDEAAEAANVLVMSDLRGVESHGVSNVLRSYVKDYREGKLNPAPGWRIVRETPSAAVVDAEKRLGVVIAPRAMRLAVKRAADTGVGVVTVRNCGHLGAIGHHAMIAAEHDMVGVCFGCSGMPSPSVLPTFSAEAKFNTNPIAIAAPAGSEAPFLFDIATSVISGNKVRLAVRLQTPLRAGWVADNKGVPIMEEIFVTSRNQFPLLPLGGTRAQGSHKGYGFVMMAEIMSTFLSGSIPIMLDSSSGSKGHFAAYDISAFTEIDEFKKQMDRMLKELRTAKPAEGHERVLYPGLPESEQIAERTANGIPLHKEVIQWFDSITGELNIAPLRRD
ncbi:MAG: Ldh family oxidoreductase [Desulfobacterales bacterium]